MKYTKGKIVEGKIIHVAEEYLLVKFPNRETGILHKSKMSPQPESDLTDLYRRNQSILVSIDWITEKGYTLGQKDIENRYENQLRHEAKELEKQKRAEERERMKELVENYASQFERGGVYKAEVISLSNQVAKISVEGIDGYIKKDELNWNENDSVKESLFEGEIIHAVFLEYTDGKLWFGLKYLEEKPYDENLYDLSLSDLLKYVGHNSNVFIGQAKQSGNYAFIENLYSCDENQKGKLLVDPIYGYNLKAVVINQIEEQIVDGEYYKVNLSRLVDKKKRLERNQVFQFAAEIIRKVDNPYQKDVEDAFKRHTTDPSGNISLVSMLDEVGRSGYSSNDRVFYELLQNADDAAPQNGVSVNFNTFGNYLIVSHDGFSFNKYDFEAITSAANGTKKSETNTTGYKGIGFKSVFLDSQKVFISSSGYNFKFDKSDNRFGSFEDFYINNNPLINKDGKIDEDAKQRFLSLYSSARNKFVPQESIPWQLEPIWVDSMPIYTTSKNVTILLEIGESNVKVYDDVITSIFQKPEFMLFLRRTNRIDFKKETISRSIKRLNNEQPLLSEITIKNSYTDGDRVQTYKRFDFSVSVTDDSFNEYNVDLRIKNKNIDGKEQRVFVRSDGTEINARIIPPKIAINSETTISFAIPCSKSGNVNPLEEKTVSLYAFLPTSDAEYWTFPFFLNANFILMSNRESIQSDNIWNDYLLQKIAVLIVELCKQLSLGGDSNALKILLKNYFSEDSPRYGRISKLFNSAYKAAIETEAFILNHKSELARQDEIIIDKTGLSKIIGADLFCQLLQTEKCLPSDNIDSEILEKDIFEHITTLKFDDVIGPITNNSDFNDWFASATEEQKKALYKWIDDNDITSRKDDLRSFVANLPLFRFFDTEYSSYRSIISDRDEITPVITTPHILPIRSVLNRLDFQCSDDLFDENHPLFEFIDLPDEEDLFNSIKNCDFSALTADERRTLFFSLADFEGVGEKKLQKEISLFKNMNGEFKPLGEMVVNNKDYPIWLNDYIIAKEECTKGLDKYMISDELVFQEIVQLSFTDIEFTSVGELYNQFKTQWTSTFTKTLIDKYGTTDDLLAIVERTDGAKHYFIEKHGRINLDNTTTADSIEYRLIRLALSSDYDVNKLKKLIFIDNRNITEFTVAPDVSITLDKEYLFPISEILPNQSENYTTFNLIKNLLSDINGSDSLFSLTRLKSSDVRNQLKELSTPAQYAFSVCYNIANSYRSQISITDEQFVTNVLDYFFEKKIDVLGKYIQYFTSQKIIGRFINSNDYTLESERLSDSIRKWANDEGKEKFLIALGVKGNLSDEIKRRKAFLNDEPISLSYSNSITNEITAFLNWCITLETPFTKDNQVKALKEMFSRLNIKTDYYSNDYQDIEEWNNQRYIEFVRNKLSIYCVENEMPKRGVYKDVHLFTEYIGDYVCLQTNRLYVNVKDKNIETVLMSVCDDRTIPLFTKEDWTMLFMVSIETLNEKEDEIIEKDNKINSLVEEIHTKDKEIEDLRAKLKAYENDEINNEDDSKDKHIPNPQTPTIKVGEPGGNGEKSKLEAQLEAQKRLIQEFPQWTFPSDYGKADDNGKPYNFSTIEVVDEYDNTIPVVLKSYKKSSEPFKINTEEWDYLIRKQAVLLIYTGADVKRVYVRDLIRKQSSIAISFSTENLDIEDKVNAFADSLHYFNELHFDFDSFNISSSVQSAAELYKRNKRAFFANDNTEDDI
ncbi:MAG: hypothetical protein PUC42_06730 [Bacteroidales bacterium]|nr:hypothetical protein [Bacteroidales bacterium]